MMAIRFGTVQKVTTLVPLALVSTAWTASLSGFGGSALASGAPPLPDGTQVPTEALEDPASYTTPGMVGLGIPEGDAAHVVATASTNGIPSAALAAYQRAETVINAADKACNIDWQLIAAIGRVESDHGRYGGNTLGTDGVARPGIYGIPLNGSNNTAEISDTDAGQYDRDKVWDRAVGPMQFIPSTWAVVGVDADGDSERNPQDIDDAALATAVYLCSGTDDLSTDAGRRAAVFRYNHSNAYVDLVLRIREAYLQGDYTAVPNYTSSAFTFTPDFDYTGPTADHGGKAKGAKGTKGTGGRGGSGGGGGGSYTPPNEEDPAPPPPPEDENGPLPGDGGGTGDSDLGETIDKTVKETEKVVEDTTNELEETVEDTTDTLTRTAASTLCTTEATTKDATTPLVNDFDKFYAECMARYGY